MPHTDTIANRLDHAAAMSRHIVERSQALLQAASLATARAWIAHRDAHQLTEMSDHILKDIGIDPDDIRPGVRRHERWP